MTRFIDDHKEAFGVEPMCAQLPIAPSTYHAVKSRPLSARALADHELEKEIQRIYDENYQVYGQGGGQDEAGMGHGVSVGEGY